MRSNLNLRLSIYKSTEEQILISDDASIPFQDSQLDSDSDCLVVYDTSKKHENEVSRGVNQFTRFIEESEAISISDSDDNAFLCINNNAVEETALSSSESDQFLQLNSKRKRLKADDVRKSHLIIPLSDTNSEFDKILETHSNDGIAKKIKHFDHSLDNESKQIEISLDNETNPKTIQKFDRKINILRSKNDCTKEITVVMCKSLNDEFSETLIPELNAAGANTRIQEMKITGAVTWFRDVYKVFDNDLRGWIAVDYRKEEENWCLIYCKAEKIASLALNQDGILNYYLKAIEIYPNMKIIFLIEELNKYFKSRDKHIQTNLNRDFQLAIKGNAAVSRFRVPPAANSALMYLADRRTIEDQLLKLQFVTRNRCIITHIKNQNIHMWIRTYTEQIAYLPEQNSRYFLSSKLKFGDTVKSGKDALDTWKRILVQISGMSDRKALAIIAMYPTIKSLYDKLNDKIVTSKSLAFLSDLIVPNDGFCGKPKALGQMLAKRVHSVLMCENPDLDCRGE